METDFFQHIQDQTSVKSFDSEHNSNLITSSSPNSRSLFELCIPMGNFYRGVKKRRDSKREKEREKKSSSDSYLSEISYLFTV